MLHLVKIGIIPSQLLELERSILMNISWDCHTPYHFFPFTRVVNHYKETSYTLTTIIVWFYSFCRNFFSFCKIFMEIPYTFSNDGKKRKKSHRWKINKTGWTPEGCVVNTAGRSPEIFLEFLVHFGYPRCVWGRYL